MKGYIKLDCATWLLWSILDFVVHDSLKGQQNGKFALKIFLYSTDKSNKIHWFLSNILSYAAVTEP